MSREFSAGRARRARRRSIAGRLRRAGSSAAVLALAGSALVLASAAPAAAGTANPVTTLSSLGASTKLADSLDSIASAAEWVGAASASTPATALVSLQHRDQAQLLAQLAQVSNPRSAEYKHYLTAQQFEARYAPTDATLASVETYLKTFGLSIASVPADRAYVSVTGNVAEMDRAFATTIDAYMLGGVLYQAPRVQLSIPSVLRGVITGVTGLDTGDIETPDIETDTNPNPFSGGAVSAAATRSVSASAAGVTSAVAARPATASSCIGTSPALPTMSRAANPLDTPPAAAYVNAAPFSTSFDSCAATQAPGYGGTATLGDVVQGYTPQQLEGAYGISTAIADGLDGAGETVAVIDAYSSPTMISDADRWSANMGLPQPKLTLDDNALEMMQSDGPTFPTDVPILGGAALLSPSGWFGEESLDVEAVHAIAPGASIIVQSAEGAEDEFLEMAQNSAVENDVASEISNSYGGSGSGGDETNTTSDGYWEMAGMEGIGVEFATGDDGDNTGGGATDADAGVDDDPNSPYVTAVGGTTLAIGASDNYEWETYWSDQTATDTNGAWGTLSYDGGGGGGTSEVYAEPSWQDGVVPSSIANYWKGNPNAQSGDTIPGRALPDVAMLADPNTGFYMGLTEDFSAYSDPLETPIALTDEDAYDQFRIGGTSLASPLFAGMMALADQAAGTRLGFADPALYALHTKTPSAFHDPDVASPVTGIVRTNYNDTTGEAGSTSANESTVLRTFDDLKGVVQALPGYDDSTGLGSPDGLAFLCGLAPNSKLLQAIPTAPCTTVPATTHPPTTAKPTKPGTTTTQPVSRPKPCALPRRYRYTQHPAAPTQETKAVLYLDGRKLRTVRSRRITRLTVARPKAAKFTVKIIATLNNGEIVSHRYVYDGCRSRSTVKVLRRGFHKV
jgi:subtilase family serine protease